MKLAIKIAGKVDSSFNAGVKHVGSGIKAMTKIAVSACAAAGAAIAGLAAAAVKVGKEFESSMSQVYATMGIDKNSKQGQADMETLASAAKEMGATTAFSASEAAEGLNYLALAGYSAEEAATALPYTLKLAGAGAMELADASDMVTDAMSALNLEANESNLSAFSDQLAKSASTTNTSVQQLGEAILTVGANAATMAGGTAELNAALGILANNGMKGSEGGTHLRNMLLSLQSPTSAAAKELDALGVSVYDAQGNMRSLNDIFVDMQKGMEGYSQQEVDSAFAAIFNKRDLAAAKAMMKASGEEFANLEKTIANSAGACDQMYSTQLDNLEGDITIFKSALEGLGIEIYENIGGGVRDAVQLGTECLGDLNTAFQEGGIKGMLGEVGTVLSKIVDYVADIGPDLVVAAVDLVISFVTGLRNSTDKIADAAATMLSVLVSGVAQIAPQLFLLAYDLAISVLSSLAAELPGMLDVLVAAIVDFPSQLVSLLPGLLNAGIELLMAVAQGIVLALPKLIVAARELVLGLCDFINANLPSLLQAAISIVMALVEGIIAALPELIRSAMLILNTLIECILQNLPIILSAGFQLLWSLVNGIRNNLDMIISAAITLVIELVSGLLENIPMLKSCAIQLIIALAAGLIQAIPQILAELPQIISAIIDGFANTDWSTMGKDIINGLINGLIGMWDSLKETAQNIWNSIKSIFSKKITTTAEVQNGGATPHAVGGVFTKPTLLTSVNNTSHLVGEAGSEAILPLDTLWSNMGDMFNPAFENIGDKLYALANEIEQENGNKNNDKSDKDSPPRIVYSPQIIIQGNASKEDVESALKLSQEEFEDMYNKMVREHDRIKF